MPLLTTVFPLPLSIGINVTTAVFTGSPPPIGYGFSAYGRSFPRISTFCRQVAPTVFRSLTLRLAATSACYAIPIVAVILGELAGRYFNDAIADRLIKRNSGEWRTPLSRRQLRSY